MPDVSVVVLTMGDRPTELAAAIASAKKQSGVDVEVVLVVNGGKPDVSDADIVLEPGGNLGIPGGRNLGAENSTAELICFLDDDGQLELGALLGACHRFATEPDLSALGFRIIDETGSTARRYIPGLRKDATRSRDATSFPGGGVVVRSAAFRAVGGLCGAFTYGLEETDLAWRLIDHGGRIAYDANLVMFHPRTTPSRHADFERITARNRVWLARRQLPISLGVPYIINWLIVGLVRGRDISTLLHVLGGTLAGIRSPIEGRRRMRWRTVLRLTQLGRPPVI